MFAARMSPGHPLFGKAGSLPFGETYPRSYQHGIRIEMIPATFTGIVSCHVMQSSEIFICVYRYHMCLVFSCGLYVCHTCMTGQVSNVFYK